MMAGALEVNLTMLSPKSIGHPFHFEFWKLKYDNDADWSTQKLWWGVAPTTLALSDPRKRTYQTALLQSQNYHLTLSCEQHRVGASWSRTLRTSLLTCELYFRNLFQHRPPK